MLFFNTAGPVNPADHYCLPPLQRFDLAAILLLIQQKKYFVLHAPRQTGKTTCLLALTDYLNQEGRYRALYANLEMAQAAREDVAQGIAAVVQAIAIAARDRLNETSVMALADKVLQTRPGIVALYEFLTQWAQTSALPSVMLLDEVDALVGDTLIAFLRQLRTGYTDRPQRFPQTVVLCGVRDVRDYRIHSAQDKAIITGGSAFNIKAESLRLGDFSPAQVEALYHQHTAVTGQRFTPDALARIWLLTQGQPWLVNALGYEACFRMPSGRDRTRPITLDQVEQAKENLILRRETHLDQLADKLAEARVRRVIEPLLAGQDELTGVPVDDIDYVRDLGLIRVEREVRIANPIYQEVIPRQLTYGTEVMTHQEAEWYVGVDGRLNMGALLTAFQEFFREHAEHWVERFQYKEAGPQLLLQAFLQRIVNGGGRIEREYGLGRLRTDLLVIWPYQGGVQKVVIELKLLRKSLDATLATGLPQTRAYMDRCGAGEGHLMVFDRTESKSWEEKLFRREAAVEDKTIRIWGV